MWTGKPDRRRDLFGGKGEVRVWSLLRTAMPPFDCALGCELEAGGSVGVHVQDKCSEIVICIEGAGEACVNDAVTTLAPGVVVALPLGDTLALSNTSSSMPLRYMIVKAAG
jgi:mannose-6-phosphate isomerase-like protein (cupin superfamily)